MIDQLELRGLDIMLTAEPRPRGTGYPVASCIVTGCKLCRRPFNPLRGPCGTVICPTCLLELATSDRASCSPCADDPDMCPVHRARSAA